MTLNGALFREPLSDRHFLLCRWSPGTAMEGPGSAKSLPAIGPHSSARPPRTEARQLLAPTPPHPSQWADSPKCRPLVGSSWPNQANILPHQNQAQQFHGCLCLKGSPQPACLSLPSMPDPDSSDCCKGLASCSAARPAQARGQRRPRCLE